MGAHTFSDIVAWQLARELRRELRSLCTKPQVAQDLRFRTQLLGAARSVTSNIAEGFPCSHAEFARFLQLSSRSLEEVEDRLIEALDGALITEHEARAAMDLKKRTSIAIARLRAYLLTAPDPPTYHPQPKPRRTRGGRR